MYSQRVYLCIMSRVARRRDLIIEHIAAKRVQNQSQLQELLGQVGIGVTQATLSRDLRAVGAIKSPLGYRLGEPAPERQTAQIASAMSAMAISVVAAHSMVVIRTGPGRAQSLAVEVDRNAIADVVGTLAGDDTIFLATRNPASAKRICLVFRELAQLGGDGS